MSRFPLANPMERSFQEWDAERKQAEIKARVSAFLVRLEYHANAQKNEQYDRAMQVVGPK